MADDNNARYRSNDPLGRGPAAAPASDPLAELARLIGRNDPFGEYARDPNPVAAPPPAPPEAGSHYASIPAPSYVEPAPQYQEPHYEEPQYQEPQHHEPAPQQYREPSPQYSEPAPRYSEPAPQYNQDYGQPPPAPPRYAADFPPRYAADPAPALDWPGLPAPPPGYAPSHLQAPQSPPLSAQPYDNQGFARPNYTSQPYVDPHARPGTESYPDRPNFGTPGFAAAPAPDRPGYAPPLYPHEPEAGGMPPPHDDEFYDDEPRGGRRKGLLTVVAVLALAVIGTAGAFGYRSMFGHAGSSGPPPIIRASNEPSKVAPPPATADTSASKFSYDRFGDAGKDEQVVKREEKPVDLSKVAPPRTVFPGAPVPSSPQVRSAATTATNPPSAIGEPRRVRTVPIRPEQGGDATAAPPAQQPMTVAPPRQANAAATAPADEPPAPRAAAPKPPARAALRTPPPTAAPAPAGNAPLSLSPDANSDALPPPPAQENFPPPPPRAAAPPTRVASAPASGGGSYLVQVSSQKFAEPPSPPIPVQQYPCSQCLRHTQTSASMYAAFDAWH